MHEALGASVSIVYDDEGTPGGCIATRRAFFLILRRPTFRLEAIDRHRCLLTEQPNHVSAMLNAPQGSELKLRPVAKCDADPVRSHTSPLFYVRNLRAKARKQLLGEFVDAKSRTLSAVTISPQFLPGVGATIFLRSWPPILLPSATVVARSIGLPSFSAALAKSFW